MEWELAEKIWVFLLSLSPKERWTLFGFAGSAVLALLVLLWQIWKLGKSSAKPPVVVNAATSPIVVTGPSEDDRETRRILEARLATAETETAQAKAQLADVERLKSALNSSDDELWRFHRASVPHNLLDRIHASRMKVLTFVNLKGGVGKTTLSANIAAYFESKGLKVLVIDFDYQGSLSATVLRAAGRLEVSSLSDRLLAGRMGASEIISPTLLMAPRLPNLALISTGYELNREENRMLLRWLLKMDEADPRFALARLISDDSVLGAFDLVIVDTPPRLTLATINALCASTHFVVPTILNRTSTENIGGLLGQIDQWFRKDLNPNIKFSGIVGTMTANQLQNELERAEGATTLERALEKWGPDAYIFERTIPNTARFRTDAGHDIAYLDTRATNALTRSVIDDLGAELAKRMRL